MSVNFAKMDWGALREMFDPYGRVDASPFAYADAVES